MQRWILMFGNIYCFEMDTAVSFVVGCSRDSIYASHVKLTQDNATTPYLFTIQDLIGKDDSLGKLTLNLSSLNLKYAPSEDPLTKWHALVQEGESESRGELLISYELVKRVGGQESKSTREAKVPCSR
jgi:hypothetical protein